MKLKINYFSLLVLVILVLSCSKNANNPTSYVKGIAIPTEVVQNMNNEEQYENKKEHWLESIHKSAQGDDWKIINEQNFNILAKQRENQQQKTIEQFANGFIEGEWFERGSSNQAGNLMNIDFEKNSELIYGISANGSLWKSDLNGTSWQILNNDLVFDTDIIKVIQLSLGQRRIFVSEGKLIKYSDDEGLTWQNANGFNTPDGKAIDLIQLNDVNNSLIYLCYDSNVPANKIMVSNDNGLTFNDVQFLASASSNGHKASMTTFNNGSKAYILDASNGMYVYENGAITQISVGSGFASSSYFKLEAVATPTDTVFYVLRDKSELFKSIDNGMSFNLVANLPVNSWNVGVEVAEDDPNAVYFGEVELYRSVDGGLNYTHNNWSAYYNDVANEVHADIMRLKSFVKNDGTEFCLICNHGGISVSFDHLQTTQNIGLNGLNIGQFYDVITNPIDGNRVYGGTQDQGLQYSNTAQNLGVLPLEQAISGDYGHMQVSNNGQVLWAQYPGANFYIFTGLLNTPSYAGSHDVEGNDMPSYDWIVPTAPAPNVTDDFIYVAGGDINGGNGSHLIKLEYLGFGNVNASQFTFDFKAESGDEISAINASKVDADRLYVGTENGKFYYSNDNGLTWNTSAFFNGPGVLYLYGASIISANQTPNLVFFGGSGYSNSPCFMSTDGGQNFTSISNGLPSTVIHDMAMSPDDKFVFAATDAGPYVYYIAQNEWFYIGGTSAPIGSYYSVDYVNDFDIVRFGTHGRGIWDLNITTNSAGLVKNQINQWSIYPNPVTNGVVNVKTNQIFNQSFIFKLYDLQGRVVYQTQLSSIQTSIKLPLNLKGHYILTILNQNEVIKTDRIEINQ
jgi:hypothetical protein